MYSWCIVTLVTSTGNSSGGGSAGVVVVFGSWRTPRATAAVASPERLFKHTEICLFKTTLAPQ